MDKLSYAWGLAMGSQLKGMGVSSLNIEDYTEAVKAVFEGKEPAISPEEAQKLIQDYLAELQEKATKMAREAGEKFLEENGKKEGVTTTESGLQYKVLTPADGRKYDAEKDGESAEAYVTYEGRLLDGTVFDKSDNPVPMPINEVVPGFSETLKLMPIGSEWEIYLPSELAYGEYAPGFMGPNAALIFKLKLHDIKPKKGSPDNPIQLTPEMLQQLQEAGMQPL